MRITRTLSLAIAIAVAALAVPAAHAGPADVPAVQADMHASVAQAAAEERQTQARQRPLGHAGDADWNAAPQPAIAQPVSHAPAADGGDIGWSTIGLGGLAAVLAIGGLVALNRRRGHPRRLRATV